MVRRTLIVAALLAAPALADAQVPASHAVGRRVPVNGMRLYYEVAGSGEPLIVLHMDAVGLQKADVFGYSMGAGAGLQLAIRHSAKVNRLVVASAAYDSAGLQPEFKALIPQMKVEMFLQMPFAAEYRKLSPTPDSFPALVRKLIALEQEPMSWGEELRRVKIPVLIIAGDADGYTLEHVVSMFRLLGGGVMGDMGKPLGASRLAILPATSHTAVITQVDVLQAFIDQFLKGETPKGFFQ